MIASNPSAAHSLHARSVSSRVSARRRSNLTRSAGNWRSCAFVSSSGEMSTATMRAPVSAKCAVNNPVPQPISRTLWPGCKPASLMMRAARRRARDCPAGVAQPHVASLSAAASTRPWAISFAARFARRDSGVALTMRARPSALHACDPAHRRGQSRAVFWETFRLARTTGIIRQGSDRPCGTIHFSRR